LWIGAVEVLDHSRQLFQQRFVDVLVDQDVIGRGAGLAGVEEPAPGDSASRHVEVDFGINDGGTLAA